MKLFAAVAFVLLLPLALLPVRADSGSGSGKSGGSGEPQQAALLMIEFVNEWLAPDAKLGHLMKDREQFARSQVAGREALAAARRRGMTVIHATLVLDDGYPQFGAARYGLRRAIPEAGTWLRKHDGWKFAPGFEPLPGEIVIEGRTGASAFAGSNLESYLRAGGIRDLYLAGYALHVCVESTLRDAHDRGYAAIVLEDATSAFTAGQRRHVLEDVVHHFGARLTNAGFLERVSRATRDVHATSHPPER